MLERTDEYRSAIRGPGLGEADWHLTRQGWWRMSRVSELKCKEVSAGGRDHRKSYPAHPSLCAIPVPRSLFLLYSLCTLSHLQASCCLSCEWPCRPSPIHRIDCRDDPPRPHLIPSALAHRSHTFRICLHARALGLPQSQSHFYHSLPPGHYPRYRMHRHYTQEQMRTKQPYPQP